MACFVRESVAAGGSVGDFELQSCALKVLAHSSETSELSAKHQSHSRPLRDVGHQSQANGGRTHGRGAPALSPASPPFPRAIRLPHCHPAKNPYMPSPTSSLVLPCQRSDGSGEVSSPVCLLSSCERRADRNSCTHSGLPCSVCGRSEPRRVIGNQDRLGTSGWSSSA